MKAVYLYVCLAVTVLFTQFAQAQEELFDREEYYIADEFVENENFDGAIKMYHKLLDVDSTSSVLNFKLGFCYLNTALMKDRSVEYLEKAVKNRSKAGNKEGDAPVEAFYYLGRAYRVNYRFEEAIEVFRELKKRIPESEKYFHEKIDWELGMCQNVVDLQNQHHNMNIKNLGRNVNSEYTDHSPVINADETLLIFTSRREGSTGGELAYDGEYFEDIYYSRRIGEHWSQPRPISPNINTPGHEASIGLSPDGQRLYIYKDDKGDGNIYVSILRDEWGKPVKLPEPINSKAFETHASATPDGNMLYFTSDRKGGYGGLDIYRVRRLPNGDWGKAENLGPVINTERNEEGPYIQLDGKTLYFSSQGHNTIGGFDVFRSTYDPDSGYWSEPENLGLSVNTTGNDVYYLPNADNSKAYFVSVRKEGFGKADLYTMNLQDQEAQKVTVIKGFVYQCTGELPNIKITVYDADVGSRYGVYRPQPETGKYLFVLNRGKNYTVEYRAEGQLIHKEDFYISDEAPFQMLTRTIQIRTGTPCDDNKALMPEEVRNLVEQEGTNAGDSLIVYEGKVYNKKITIKNILFPFGKANEIPPNQNLDNLAQYLKDNPDAVMEIGGYADAQGRESYNTYLSKRRAEIAKKYLTERGVPDSQLVTEGYGESNPIAINQNPDGTWNAEGQKYNRRIEFKVIKQGEEKLLVKPIMNIPEELLIKEEE